MTRVLFTERVVTFSFILLLLIRLLL